MLLTQNDCMKILTFLLLSLALTFSASAFSVGISTRKASEIYVPLGKNMQISLADLSIIKEKDFEKITGRHLTFFERLGFSSGQRKLQHSINADGTINSKKLLKVLQDDHSKGFQAGGFFLGLLGGIIGVLIAYLINDDNKRNRVKWAWIGFAINTIAGILLIIIALQALGKGFGSFNFNFI